MAMSNLRAAAIHFGRIYKRNITPKIEKFSRSTITVGNSRMLTFLPRRIEWCDVTPSIERIARFALDEYGKKENTRLELIKVLRARYQEVDGRIFYLTLEATDAGKKKIYDAGVLHMPWSESPEMNLVVFIHVLYRPIHLDDE